MKTNKRKKIIKVLGPAGAGPNTDGSCLGQDPKLSDGLHRPNNPFDLQTKKTTPPQALQCHP